MRQYLNTTRVGHALGLVLAVLWGAGLTGCAGGLAGIRGPAQSQPGTYEMAYHQPIAPLPATPVNLPQDGSLWQEDAPLNTMFANIKAREVGDIITIKIIESSQASNKASTDTGRDSSFSAKVDGFFNGEKNYGTDQPFFNPFAKVAGGMSSEFEGTGTTKRSGDLDAHITAMVTHVLPNGNFVVTGSREVLINNENQVIQLTGVVRPRDISWDNEVLSTFVADARISYSGSGIINERQKPGWLTSIMMNVWPF